MSNILTQAAGSRRGFLKVTGLAGLATLAATGATQAEEQMEVTADPAVAAEIAKLPRVKQVLVDPPFVPEHRQKAEGGPASSRSRCPSSRRRCRWMMTAPRSGPSPSTAPCPAP